MKYAVVKSVDLFASGRWDAGYHIARAENTDAVAALLAMPEADFDRLFALTPRYADALAVVVKAGHRRKAAEAIEKYTPEEKAVFLALALQQIGEMEARVKTLRVEADHLSAMKAEIDQLVADRKECANVKSRGSRGADAEPSQPVRGRRGP